MNFIILVSGTLFWFNKSNSLYLSNCVM